MQYDPTHAYAPVAGPADRTSFLEEQARNRRASWRMGALCALAIFIMGIPVSIVLTPLLYGSALLTIDVIRLAVPFRNPMPYIQKHWLDDPPRPVKASPHSKQDDSPVKVLSVAALVLMPPGILALLVIWLSMQRLFLRSGAGGVLMSFGARPPQLDDFEEKQLSNLVEEMSVAAGVPPPKLALLDVKSPCAAAVGSSMSDATVLVSRQLLDQFDRDETTAVVGHLIASVGNGDLRISMLMVSVYQSLGMLMTILQMPFGPKSRGIVLRVLRLALFPRRQIPGRLDTEVEALSELLTSMVAIEDKGDVDAYTSKNSKTVILDIIRMPFLIAYMVVWMTQSFAIGGLVRPMMARTWRTRRHLADASAVQLTRQADPLVRALRRLSYPRGSEFEMTSAAWAIPLFVAPPGIQSRDSGAWNKFLPDYQDRAHRLIAMGASPESAGDLTKPPGMLQQLTRDFRHSSQAQKLVIIGLVLLFTTLGTAGFAAIVTCIVLLTGIAIAVDMMFFAPVILLLHFLLAWLATKIHG